MNDKERILAALINETRYLQAGIRDGLDTASGAALRSMLALLQRELEINEWESYTVADRLGLHLDGLLPISRLLSNGLCRIRLHFRSSDSCVAEILIQNITKSMIRFQKAVNQTAKCTEPGTELLIHRFFCCINNTIRSLQPFL